ncbi:hypothetical protein [Leuconostoc mesenteroides]|uniref:hypothetical protein n=1 Tax=Leuconostoc mesenteroides TaxID=1245 RepID=UPI0030D5C1EE
MKMYKAVGWHSQNEYMAGNTLADVMRKLQKAYPAPKRTSRGHSKQHIYDEPLIIKK